MQNETSTDDTQLIPKEALYELQDSLIWLKVIAICSLISGIITALTVIGILIAWFPIWLGIVLLQTANRLDVAQKQNDRYQLTEGLEKLKLYLVIKGSAALCILIILPLIVVLGIFAANIA